MKLLSISLLAFVVAFSSGCSSKMGTQLKTPFSSKSYMSNAKYFRATGHGVSIREQVATSKAHLEAHKDLAQQVTTTIQVVSDAYLLDTQGEHVNTAIERFESLAREITNTTIGDLRKIGEKKYVMDDDNYSVYVAYEIKKTAMFRFLKKKARLDEKISSLERTQIINMCDMEIERIESEK